MSTKIVIIGGGFGGIYTAKHLLKQFKNNKEIEITLINKENYFLFTPMLHEVATGGLNRYHITESIRDILYAQNFHFLKAEVTEINFEQKMISTNNVCLYYDYLVIAIGATNNFFNISGADKYALQLKNIEDARNIKNKVIDCLEHAEMLAKQNNNNENNNQNNKQKSEEINQKNTNSNKINQEEIKRLLNFVVCGGGPTGVEITAELTEFIENNIKQFNSIKKENINIYLIQRDSRILSMLDQKCSDAAAATLQKKGIKIQLNCACTSMDENAIYFADKTKIESYTKIWSAGVKPNKIKTIPTIADERGFFHVNQYLQLEKRNEKDNAIQIINNVFVIGDCALFFNKNETKPVPQTAQAATKEAKIAAINIKNLIEKRELTEFHFSEAGFLVSIGQRYAIADIKGFHFKGLFAWFLWRTIYLFKIIGVKNKLRIMYEWTLRLFMRRENTRL